MEKYSDVIKQAVNLSDTILEAILHTRKLIDECKNEQAIFMFEESMKGYAQLNTSIKPIALEIENNDLCTVLDNITDSAYNVVEFFGFKDFQKVIEILQFSLIPQFSQFQRIMTSSFEPLLLQ
ncbi:hypothetical protein [Jeotgalibacillus sp. R-1-5s-1]|uniref:hypothetical protein n=1 Tax=Jeotgalibacillus sp. R-1-5s-1 TaxID=2555897 RepID=UPI00106B10E3|nr:hypothetical protein [Jeotgalibacillus sp. R-1-5s-1]TFD95800.1 hypothetical protein E2491_11505 [Jeotgalibacillus sp. R-1-5s-1]